MKRNDWTPHQRASSADSSTARRPLRGDAEPDELALVRRVLDGDVEAFRPLIERYEAALFGLTRRLLGGDAREAEDVTQETFVRAFECLGRLEAPERFRAWLFQIARSLCRDRVRRQAAERRALERRVELLRLASVPVDNDIGSVLSSLPPEEYDALRLKYFDGLRYDEIASRMGLTFGKVDHLIRKARARLAHRLEVERRRERTL